jgi:hypothetical protein
MTNQGDTLSAAQGSALFSRAMAEADDLMRSVWAGTPWMLEAYTGGPDDERWEQIAYWCENQFGPEAWPIHGHVGKWHRGGATVNGFTWMGFATEEMMNQFQAAWPNNKGQTPAQP